MLPDSGIMRKRWLVNSIFVAAACIITGWLILQTRKTGEEEQIHQPEGVAVFCEGEEISALYLAEDGSLWIGGRDGVKRLDPETGEVIGYVAEDLELIYAAEICRSYDGSVWIGHNQGVSVLYPEGTREDYGEPFLTGGRVDTCVLGRRCWWVQWKVQTALYGKKTDTGRLWSSTAGKTGFWRIR